MKAHFKENLLQDMKATMLYYEMKNKVGYCQDANEDGMYKQLKLSYPWLWNLDDETFKHKNSAME